MPAGAAEAFVAKCRELKLDFVVFVRHASSAPLHAGAAKRAEKPHDWKIDDQMRVLTQKGKDQCAAAAWFRELDVRAALTSPARRASETAMRMTDRTETEEQKVGSVYLRMVAGVHPAGIVTPSAWALARSRATPHQGSGPPRAQQKPSACALPKVAVACLGSWGERRRRSHQSGHAPRFRDAIRLLCMEIHAFVVEQVAKR